MVKFKAFLCCFSSQEPELSNTPQKVSTELPSPAPEAKTPQVVSFPRLTLKVLESPQLPVDAEFVLTPTGLASGRRGVRDGCSYFGSALLRTHSPGNDYVWPESEEGLGGQHFAIKFDQSSHSFMVVDMGEGNGTFLRVREWREFASKTVISFEETHTLVELQAGSKLRIQFVEGPKAGEAYVFSPEDRQIFIGRMSDCRINIEDSQSRYLASFKFDKKRGWLVADGDGMRLSAYGVWLFVEKGAPLTDNCEFKAGMTRFGVRVAQE